MHKLSGKLLIFLFFVLLIAIYVKPVAAQQTKELSSPDGKLIFNFSLTEDGIPGYSISYLGMPVILSSNLGINDWQKNLLLSDVALSEMDTIWKQVYGERSLVRDCYRQMDLTLLHRNKGKASVQLRIRAYNEGIAFRYQFPEGENGGSYLHITGESTEFNFQPETKAWFTPRAQSLHQLLPLKNWPDESDRPLTLELPNGLFACLAEAEMTNYARTKFKLNPGKDNSILCSLYGEVDEIAPFHSPWRVIMVAEKAGQLLANNDLILNLNPPCEIKNTSWIKPGKVMREVTLSTDGAIRLVDFAAAHHPQYIHFDAGWYGFENAIASDATTVNVDPRRNPKNDLDLQKVIKYAKSKGLGVILYVNQRALAAQLDTILPLYHSWGVSGVKFGFVQVGSHRWTTWLHEAIRKCAKYQLMVDIHDEYRPTGFTRTYPNLLTQEGVRGNEEMPDANNNTILPFTRYIAGPADYTYCYYFRKELGHPARFIQNSSAHQLALPVVYYSPFQYLFWYDKPEDYQGEPEIAFWEAVPTVWDDTKVLCGQISKFISVARRSGEEWFVGTITNTEARELKLPLSFLEKGRKYEATIYSDDPTVNTRTKVAIRQLKVDASTVLTTRLYASGGEAMVIRSVN
jgi:alpha-glucosidase